MEAISEQDENEESEDFEIVKQRAWDQKYYEQHPKKLQKLTQPPKQPSK
jgi:hypothetical protein